MTWRSYQEVEVKKAAGPVTTARVWDFNICKRDITAYFAVYVVTRHRDIYKSKTWCFLKPNWVFFVPKPNQSVSKTLSQHEIENWTLRNVKFKRVSGLQNIYSCEWFEFPSKKKKETSVFMILGCGWSRHIHSCVCGKKTKTKNRNFKPKQDVFFTLTESYLCRTLTRA